MADHSKKQNRMPLRDIDLNVEITESSGEEQITGKIIEENENRGVNLDLNTNAEIPVHSPTHEELTLGEADLSNMDAYMVEEDDDRIEFDLNMEPLDEVEFSSHEFNEAASDIEALDIDAFGGDTKERVRPTNRNLTNDERRAIYDVLLERSVGRKLKHGVTKSVAALFSVSIRTVQRIWKMSKDTTNGQVDVSQRRTRNCGRKRVQVDINRIREVPLKQRTTLRSLAYALNVTKTNLVRLLKSGKIRRHSNAIKPCLTDENKKARLRFCLSMLDPVSLPHDPMFVDMFNIVHIDEKWFNLTKKSKNCYLVPDEDEPLRTCKSKIFIGKVMFLVAMARPRFDAQGNELFSRKIGVYPFITKEQAKRTSANRLAGTWETKPITSVRRDIIKSFLIEKVIPSIRSKWPEHDSGSPIFIQQDNARTHVSPDDIEFREAASHDGFDIRLMCQPPNSPDLNILDLGFFSALQSLQYKECPKNVDQLVAAVNKSFEEYSSIKVNRIFLTLQLCMAEIMKGNGSNKYAIPHVNKIALERQGKLPVDSNVIKNWYNV